MGSGGRAGLAFCNNKPIETVDNLCKVLLALVKQRSKRIIAPLSLSKRRKHATKGTKEAIEEGTGARKSNTTSKTTPRPTVSGKDG